MTWGQCHSAYPGKQEAGGQEPISRPCNAIAPPLQMEVGKEEVQLGERRPDGDTIQDDRDTSDPEERISEPDSLSGNMKQKLPEKVKQKARRQKEREKSQNRARKMEENKGNLQERAPGVPTGPGEEERGGGMFRGLDMQLTAEETEDFRGMGRGLQKRGPPDVVPLS